MTRFSKTTLCFTVAICLLVAMISLYTATKKRTVASLMERARYAVVNSRTNQVPRSVALELAEKVRKCSSIRISQKKSVSYGSISLLDSNMKPIVRVGVLKYPLFQVNDIQSEHRIQFELQFDLVSAYGFSMRGYNALKHEK